ncbi:RNA-binding S4 domain-containing protein [Rhizobium sp. SGZ-381]|uniref:RNA-binding S4 domain-containing protein n=1 Tax=Rhizobium sp. SGZ-381 TaxID=3342800 RepID=UPI00367006F0
MPEKPLEEQRQRIDKWLFFARLAKSRSLAQDLVEAGFVTINGHVIVQSGRQVKAGDRIEIRLERRDVMLIVRDCADRRGPAPVARLLYEDVTPQQAPLTAFERALRKP